LIERRRISKRSASKLAPSSVVNILSAIVRLARKGPRYDTHREFPRIWLDALNRDFLSILYGRHLLIDAEQLP
jgi:hypothetical protein